jgi:hypothetical protein
MTLSPHNPTISYDISFTANAGSLTFTPHNPTVNVASSDVEVSAAAGSMTMSAHNVSIAYDVGITAALGSMTFVGYSQGIDDGLPTAPSDTSDRMGGRIAMMRGLGRR